MSQANFKMAAVFVAGMVTAIAANAEVVTSLGVEEVYDNNIYRQAKDKVDSWVTKINPGVELTADLGITKFSLNADAESGVYSQSKLGDDDYTDYSVEGVFDFRFDARNKFEVGAHDDKSHDERGTGRMDVLGKLVAVADSSEPDEWREQGVRAKYSFGAENAKGAFSLEGKLDSKDYTNNTPSTDILDRQTTELIALGTFRVMPHTSLLLEARDKTLEYDETTPNRDSEEVRYFIGAEWETTAKTTSSVRLGYQEKDPDDPALDSFDGNAWEVDVQWAPKTYSTFQLVAYKGVEDTSNADGYVDYESYTLRWKHSWSARLKSQLFLRQETQDYVGVNRNDDVDSWGFSVNYRALKWLNLSGEYKYEDKNSSIDGLDFDRNVVTFGADMEFK